MKVKELIEKLQKCDQEKEVVTRRYDSFGKWYTTEPIIEEYNHNIYIS